MTTDDDNNNSNNKKGKTAAAELPSAPTSPNFHGRLTSLSDAVVSSVSELMNTFSLLRLSETSKDLLDVFGGRLSNVELWWHGDELPPFSLLRFLRRQQQLKVLVLADSDLLPVVSMSLVEKPMRSLHTLRFYFEDGHREVRQADAFALAHAIESNALPALDLLNLDAIFYRGAFPILIRSLARGACPRLRKIDFLPIPFMAPDVDDDGNIQPGSSDDPSETWECMEAFADMLEERSATGGCVGLKEVEGGWLSCDEPSLEKLEECYSREAEEVLARVVAEVEAPHLTEFFVHHPLLLREIVKRPDSLGALRHLSIAISMGRGSHPTRLVDMTDITRLGSALENGAWPHLEDFTIANYCLGGGFQVVIESLTKRDSAKGLLELKMLGDSDEAVVGLLVNGFQRGNFRELKKLGLSCLDNHGAVQLAKMLQEGCAPHLRTLNLYTTKIQAEGAGALVFAILTACPAMRTLTLPANIKEEDRGAITGNLRVGNRQGTLDVKYGSY